ncbi:hypothetical protein [Bradyrhizobium ivorense]|uniref:hypothetical protein n=1 Tax=Bradyrhizobium ivorense TaxID=2511166 RepID=UPI0010BBBDC9|nr:hypothetical protein [Bradyrhizobium ivorense]VIO77394.1 hypothetical protein CI41S_56490 [Bradyrhizobium ivorense]
MGAPINPVLAALAQARLRAAPMFVRWCELHGVIPCPATPAAVARFIADCASLGIERLWPAVQEISKLHMSAGLADPTLGGPAAAAIADIAGIDPPLSWPDARKQRFKALPYDMQLFIATHESRREKALRRAQNDAATVAKDLAARQPSPNQTKPERTTDEANPHAAA